MRLGVMLLGAGLAAVAGCGKKDAPAGTGAGPVPAAGPAPFLEGTKAVPARKEWNRDFFVRTDGAVRFKVTSAAPVAVTVIADRSYQALLANNPKGMVKSDVLLTVNAKPPAYEGRLAVPAGRFWFIIENQSDAPADIRLECYDAG